MRPGSEFSPWAMAVLVAALAGCFDNFERRAPCEGVTCSGHGVCVDNDDLAVCVCESGFRAEETHCIAVVADGDADSDADGDGHADLDADLDRDVDPERDVDPDPEADSDADHGPDPTACDDELAGAMFCDGFEDGTFERWSGSDTDHGTVDRSGELAYRGAGALRAEVLAPGGYARLNASDFGATLSGEVYVRAYVYIPPVPDLAGASLLSIGECEEPWNHVGFSISTGDTPVIWIDETASAFHGWELAVPRDEWFCVLLRTSIDPILGAVDLMINDEAVASVVDIDTELAGGYGCLVAGLEWTSLDQAPFAVHMDEVVVDNWPLRCDR